MNTLRKVLIIASLGLLMWSLGLVWLELNFALILAIALAVALVIGSVALALSWRDRLDHNQPHRPKPRQPSRPVTVH
jgi:hypothetical protein